MSNHSESRFKWIMGSQYFLYFGVLGVFLPYFNLYCFRLGFSGFQIGVLSALRSLALVLFPLLWAMVADRFQARRPIYIACNWISAGIWLFYLFTSDFTTMFWITIAYGVFFSPIISFMEAFTMDLLGREKRRYGRLRVWGTFSFILMVTVTGWLIDLYEADVILIIIFAGAFLQALITLWIPPVGGVRGMDFSGRTGFLFNRQVMVFLFCAFLMLSSHGTYYGFFSIHLERLGYDSTFIGLAWSLAPAAEIAVMIWSDRIFSRFSLERVLCVSFLVAAFRWLILFLNASPAVILASQVLHAFTYGTFHIASILYIDRLSPEEGKTLGQAANNALSYGLGMMVGLFLSGYLFERIGSFALFGFSSLAALAGGVILMVSFGVSGKE